MQKSHIPLFMGSPKDKAIIQPGDYFKTVKKLKKLKISNIPKYCVLCFFSGFYEIVKRKFKPKIIKYSNQCPIYIINYKGVKIAFIYPLMGASFAGTVLEEMIAMGGKYFIFFGGVGTIDPKIKPGDIIVTDKAIRDEGTSFHYQKPSKYCYPSKFMLKFIKKCLREKKVPFHEGGTWTTDAPYRETRKKRSSFLKEGILTVEMEASALFSIAKYRKVHIGGIFVAEDFVSEKIWSPITKKKDILKIKKMEKKLLDYSLDMIHLIGQTLKNKSIC